MLLKWCGWAYGTIPVWALSCLIVQQTWRVMSVYIHDRICVMSSASGLWMQDHKWFYVCRGKTWRLHCRLHTVIVCLAFDMVSTGEGHTYTHSGFSGFDRHAWPCSYREPIRWSHYGPCARCCLFVWSRTRLRASSTTLRLNATKDAQSLPRHCGVIGAVCGTLWLFRFGEEKAEPPATW